MKYLHDIYLYSLICIPFIRSIIQRYMEFDALLRVGLTVMASRVISCLGVFLPVSARSYALRRLINARLSSANRSSDGLYEVTDAVVSAQHTRSSVLDSSGRRRVGISGRMTNYVCASD